jgi:DNA-binding HxlR family transcriptional regulator
VNEHNRDTGEEVDSGDFAKMKWKAVRFTEIKKALAGISRSMLSGRLSELEKEGLMTKKVYSEIPTKVEYSHTYGNGA